VEQENTVMAYYDRKSTRIPQYDYSSENYYFITICTHNRKCVFGSPDRLTSAGKIAFAHIVDIDKHYDHVFIDKFVVMPNHIHMILVLKSGNRADAEQIIAQYKSGVTREVRKMIPGIKLWQRSFHDHVIRNQKSYENIWLYIEGNPQNWCQDCFYTEFTGFVT